ncbi:LysR family transcriptional regulator [Paraburkholderia bengalensis]|uniref:LysR family transcriptional regulator n=1 Tax=Paraburkholderia bengalensis TaxID=2747562 RepID=A0ABU8J2Q0_9BURK
MDTLQRMRIFARVADAGSLTAAAQQLNLTITNVSRAITDLEAQLNTRLLNRTTRRIALTEAGDRYLQRCVQIFSYIEQAEAEARNAHARPSGRLRVYVWTSFGQHYVVPAAARYRKLYPDVQLELTLSQRIPDLIEDGYDIVLAMAEKAPDSDLVWQWLGSVFSIVCASSKYLERNGIPLAPPDLEVHACMQIINPVTSSTHWTLNGPKGQETVRLKTNFQVNIAEAMAIAVREGMGISLLPVYSAISGLRNREFEWILREYVAQEMHVYALHSPQRYLDAKIRTWLDFLREELPAMLAADREALEELAKIQA